MVLTPSGSRGKKSKKKKIIPRRIIDAPLSNEDESPNKENRISESPEVSPDDKTSSKMSYSLRSHNRSDTISSSPKTRSQFYKSVLTPSRVKSQQTPRVSNSIFRTPRIRSTLRRHYSIPKPSKRVDNQIRNEWKENVKNIINRSWKINYLSSLSGFHYAKKNIKSSYQRTLTARILEVFPSFHLTVTIKSSSFLSQIVKKTDSVHVKVTSMVPDDEEEMKMVDIYDGVLFTSPLTQSKAVKDVQWFPLMLHSGLDIIHKTFIRWLQSSFGCYVTSHCVPQTSILWVAGIWMHGNCSNPNHKAENDREVSLHYQVRPSTQIAFDPPNDKGKIMIKMKCKGKDLDNLWTAIKGKGEKEHNAEDISNFHHAVETYVESLTNLPKGLLRIVQVVTPCIALAANGKVKMTCDTTFISMLQHLIEIFQHTSHAHHLDPDDEDIGETDSETDQFEHEF